MAEKSLYDILGVSEDATEADIKKAYRKLVRKYHPDVSDAPDADEKIAEINNAYETLKDNEKRAEYDAIRSTPFGSQGGFGAGGTSSGGFRWEDIKDQFGEGAPFGSGSFRFDDIFSAFGAGGAQAGAHSGRQSRQAGSQGFESFEGFEQFGGGFSQAGPTPGQDQHAEISVNLDSVYKGDEYSIKINVPTRQANGSIVQELKTLKIKIPKGITEGKQIRLSGQGAASYAGGKNGDLFLKVAISHPENIRLEDADVYQTVNITPWEAALGEKINISTPAGKLGVTIPKNSKSGSHLRVRGKGIPAKQPGDLYLTLNIINPEVTTDTQKEAFSALKASFAETKIQR